MKSIRDAKIGDILSRITFSIDGRLTTTEYEVVDKIRPCDFYYSDVHMRMTKTDRSEFIGLVGKCHREPIANNFSDDGIEVRKEQIKRDIFVMGDDSQTIIKAKSIIILSHNRELRRIEELKKRRRKKT